jgi:hypothetical protein
MKTTFLLLAALFGLSGCVNLHVHFPEAPAAKAAGAGEPAQPQGNPGGAAK